MALQAAGRKAVCVGLEPLGQEFDYLEGLAEIIPADKYVPQEDDAMAIVDCGELSRINQKLREFAQQSALFCIDHHKSNSGFAKMQLIDSEASSTAELVYLVIKEGAMPITRGIAEALWTGLVTDTGRFAYSNTSADSLRHGSEFLKYGVRTMLINDMIYEQVELSRLSLMQTLITSLTLAKDGKICIVSLGPQDYAAVGGDAIDSDNFVNVARNVVGVQIAVFIWQDNENEPVHVSMRTRPPYDAASICSEWGGGGHAGAAGASVDGDVPSVRKMVQEHLKKIIR
jgi:phosphoesterase RecJ-like protein